MRETSPQKRRGNKAFHGQVLDHVDHLAEENGRVNVAVFWNWGKYRSVAFVELLGERLDDARLSVQITHMERYCWDRDQALL